MTNKEAINYYNSISSEVESFCKPLNDYFGIALFAYMKVYKNSQYIFISNDSKMTQDYILNINQSNVFYRDYLDTTNSSYDPVLWPTIPTNPSMEIYYNHRYWHGLSLVNRNDNYFEGICFLADKDNSSINDTYLKHLKALEKYAAHFESKFSDNIIVKANQNLATFEQGFNFYMPPKKIKSKDINIQEFLQASGVKGCSLNISGKFVNFTQREMQSLELMSKGLSMKSMARELLLSPRTIETHINNIKQKTGYQYKYDLIKMYHNHF